LVIAIGCKDLNLPAKVKKTVEIGFSGLILSKEKDLLGSQAILAVELLLLELAVLAVHKLLFTIAKPFKSRFKLARRRHVPNRKC
jgi:hypothetical protein